MAALAENYTQPEPFEVPEGGIATFLTATTGEWAEADKDNIPVTGIAGVKQVADKLAEYGRYEDEYMVHAAEGETVIPAQVLDLNPRLKAKLYREMREMGLEPERYIVGNELNSLNPVTGQPEFFLKKLVKSIKKAVKSVVKVIKKVAPVVLPVVGAVFGGPLGAALASGAVTAAQGGNLKDVLKSAALAGVTTGVAQGVSAGVGAAQAGSATGLGNIGEFASGFGESVSSGLSGGYTQQFAEMVGRLGGSGGTLPDPQSPTYMEDIGAGEVANLNLGTGTLPTGTPAAALPAGSTEANVAGTLDTSFLIDPLGTAPAPAPIGTDFAAQAAESTAQLQSLGIDPSLTGPSQLQLADLGVTPEMQAQAGADLVGTAGQSLGETFGNIFRPESFSDFGSNLRELFMPTDINDLMAKLRNANPTKYLGEAGQELLEKEAATLLENAGRSVAEAGLMRTYGPAALGAYGLLAATGGFDPQEVEAPQPFGGLTGSDYLSQTRPVFAPGVFRYAAGGGDIANFPRKNGAIYGPGTETSDDIPAMLSDGEFVMTARAVRGAGNGDRELGMKRMYDIMSRFEGDAIRGN